MGDIDEGLYSRQLCVIGKDAMQSMARSSILIVGLGGVGSETAKNLALAGVHRIVIVDDRQLTTHDLGNNFLITVSCRPQ